MKRWLLAVALLPFSSGCAARSHWAGELDPATALPAPGSPISVRVSAATASAETHVADFSRLLMEELRVAGFPVVGSPSPAAELDLSITHVAPGGAWGEEAECHVEVRVTLQPGGNAGSFKAIGYSGSTWAHDRIPNALAEAAKAVAGRLKSSRP